MNIYVASYGTVAVLVFGICLFFRKGFVLSILTGIFWPIMCTIALILLLMGRK